MKIRYDTFDRLALLNIPSVGQVDKFGNQVLVYQSQEVLCNIRSVDRAQFYNAGISGYKLTYIVTINDFEYQNATKIEIDGKEYEIIRIYNLDNGLLEMTVGEKAGNTK